MIPAPSEEGVFFDKALFGAHFNRLCHALAHSGVLPHMEGGRISLSLEKPEETQPKETTDPAPPESCALATVTGAATEISSVRQVSSLKQMLGSGSTRDTARLGARPVSSLAVRGAHLPLYAPRRPTRAASTR